MTSNSTTLQSNKKRVLTANEYRDLCDFINDYDGLSRHCERELQDKFPQIHRMTLNAILQTELTYRMRFQYWRYEEAKAQEYLKRYEELSSNYPDDNWILLNIARKERICPVMMCRSLLKLKYTNTKVKLRKLMRYPHLIDDPWLSANVARCLCSDLQDGPLIDLRRRVMEEEYEFKLKHMAKKAGMHFYDKNVLRRLGYDKTPDIKIIKPFLYKGVVINWIQSKAKFGDIKTHKWNMQQQLSCYCNRFGTGIIIYWFGYHESITNPPDNSIEIIVLDDFPSNNDIQLLDLSKQVESAVTKEQET